MLAVIHSATMFGIDALPIRVEVDLASGLPGFATVGLPENSVKEARVRVQAAISNSGFVFPVGRITVNLAPANLRKDGTGFDFPIALGILVTTGFLPKDRIESCFILGELSLSGEIRPVRGALAAAQVAFEQGFKRMLVAKENGSEAALVEGIEVRTVANFKDAIDYLMGQDESKAPVAQPAEHQNSEELLDLADVRGQHQAKRALEIAAAGGHNIIFVGGPGSGKTMMARRLPSILPPMAHGEAIEVTRIHSAAGLTVGSGLIRTRPFRAPHHSMTRAGLVGGGNGIPRPGELSLATNGVLFLDELPEFSRHVLEVLRQPLESGEVVLSRANATLRYPAKIMLVAAMNPCPCGNNGTPRRVCKCSHNDIVRYRSRLSGPLLDRIDLHVHVPPVDLVELTGSNAGETSAQVAARVAQARARKDEPIKPTERAKQMLVMAVERLGLSARAYDRTLRVARTIAHLEGASSVDVPHIGEAIQYRSDERMLLAA